jgi:hypothetical protein
VYAFTPAGTLIDSVAANGKSATLSIPPDFDGRNIEIWVGPPPQKQTATMRVASLQRMQAYRVSHRVLAKNPPLTLRIPDHLLPRWCFCLVRGRLVKRFTLPNGEQVERPVCNARVHICDVDRWPFIVSKIPDDTLPRLRDDILDRLGKIPKIPEWKQPIPIHPTPDRLMHDGHR